MSVNIDQFKWNFRLLLQNKFPEGWQINAAEDGNTFSSLYYKYFNRYFEGPSEVIKSAKTWEDVISILFKDNKEVKTYKPRGIKMWRSMQGVSEKEMLAIAYHGCEYYKIKQYLLQHSSPNPNTSQNSYDRNPPITDKVKKQHFSRKTLGVKTESKHRVENVRNYKEHNYAKTRMVPDHLSPNKKDQMNPVGLNKLQLLNANNNTQKLCLETEANQTNVDQGMKKQQSMDEPCTSKDVQENLQKGLQLDSEKVIDGQGSSSRQDFGSSRVHARVHARVHRNGHALPSLLYSPIRRRSPSLESRISYTSRIARDNNRRRSSRSGSPERRNDHRYKSFQNRTRSRSRSRSRSRGSRH